MQTMICVGIISFNAETFECCTFQTYFENLDIAFRTIVNLNRSAIGSLHYFPTKIYEPEQSFLYKPYLYPWTRKL